MASKFRIVCSESPAERSSSVRASCRRGCRWWSRIVLVAVARKRNCRDVVGEVALGKLRRDLQARKIPRARANTQVSTLLLLP